MTYEEFASAISSKVKSTPTSWRYGQAVFNIVDYEYGVARDVQSIDNVDCYYNDDLVEEFLKKAYVRIQIKNES